MIQIVCKRPGFRRAGIAHPASAVYPTDKFTAEQLKALKAEPMLIVTEVPDKVEDTKGDKPSGKKA